MGMVCQYLPRQKHLTMSHIITNITRNSFQLFTTSTPTANFLSSLICTDCTTQQLSRHTSKVSKNLQLLHCLHRQTSSNKFTNSMVKELTMASWWYKAVQKSTLWTLDSGEPACAVNARIGWESTFLVNIPLECFAFHNNGAGRSYLKSINNPIL